jgi:hypothetical protein
MATHLRRTQGRWPFLDVTLLLDDFQFPLPAPDLFILSGHPSLPADSVFTLIGERPNGQIAYLVSPTTKLMASSAIDNEKSRYKERLSLAQNS